MNCVKLKNQFVFDTSSFKVNESTTFISHGEVNYYNIIIPESIRQLIFSVIPVEFHKFFSVFYLSGGGILAPHTDQTSTCTILFYDNPGNFRTSFYELVNTNADLIKSNPSNINTDVKRLPNEEYSPIVYKNEDLKNINNYVARPNEAWCINGKIIHSVDALDNVSSLKRSALALDTSVLPFNTVVNLLKQTNSI